MPESADLSFFSQFLEILINYWYITTPIVVVIFVVISKLLGFSLNLRTFYKGRILFRASWYNPIMGDWEKGFKDGSSVKAPFLLFPMSIINNGDEPLSPREYKMFFKLESKKWEELRTERVIEELSELEIGSQILTIENPHENNIQAFKGVITKENPLHGFLIFVSQIDFKQIKAEKLTFKLVCVDALNKERSSTHTFDLKEKKDVTAELSKFGISARKK